MSYEASENSVLMAHALYGRYFLRQVHLPNKPMVTFLEWTHIVVVNNRVFSPSTTVSHLRSPPPPTASLHRPHVRGGAVENSANMKPEIAAKRRISSDEWAGLPRSRKRRERNYARRRAARSKVRGHWQFSGFTVLY